MLRRVFRAASAAAKGHGHDLPGPPCSGRSAPCQSFLVGAPSRASLPAAGIVPGPIIRPFSSSYTAPSSASARICVPSVCTSLASRLLSSSTTGDGNEPEEEKLGLGNPTPDQMEIPTVTDPDDPDLVHPEQHFIENPILVDVDNEFVSGGCKSAKKVPDAIRETFHSLVDLVVEHHIDKKALVEALEEGNLLINVKTGRFVLRAIGSHSLNSARESADFMKVRELIVKYVERRHGKGSAKLLPKDFQDLLNKLIADCLNVRLIFMHPAFMTCLDRVLFRTLSDVCVRRPAMHQKMKQGNKGNKKDTLKWKLLKALSGMPYTKSVSGEDSSQTLKSIVETNQILQSANTHRENEKKQRDNVKNELAAARRRVKEEKKSRKQSLATTGRIHKGKGGAVRGGTDKRTETAVARGPQNLAARNRRGFATEAAGRVEFDQTIIKEAFRLIALNRDCVNHLEEIAKRLQKNISLEKLSEMLHLQFPAYEYRLLDLLEEEGIWDIHLMATIFKVSARKLQAIINQEKLCDEQKGTQLRAKNLRKDIELT